MENLKIRIDSAGRRLLTRFIYGQQDPEPGVSLFPDYIDLPKTMKEESDLSDKIIKRAAEKGKAANSYRVYLENLD